MGMPTSSTRASAGWRPGAVVAFFALAYALSWAWTIPLIVAGDEVRRGQGWPTHYPALLGPAVAAVLVIGGTTGRAGLRELGGRLLDWRIGWRWWLAAVSPAAFLALTLLAVAVTGGTLPAVADFGSFSGTPMIGVLGVFALIVLVGAVGEEVGWRGYALPQLQRRFSPLVATAILAPLWWAWHLPQFFVLQTYRDFTPIEYLGMLFGLSCGTWVLTWLFNGSGGSLLAVVVWHGVYNCVSATQASTGVVAAAVTTMVMAQAAVLLVLRRRVPAPSTE